MRNPEQIAGDEKQMVCLHENFECNCIIARLTKEEGGGVDGYMADITIRCVQCGQPFSFKGLPQGTSFRQPMTDPLGFELRAPIEPKAQPIQPVQVFEVSREQLESEAGDDSE